MCTFSTCIKDSAELTIVQVSDAKQCGHQAGKVTVPHEDFIAKINAVRYNVFSHQIVFQVNVG